MCIFRLTITIENQRVVNLLIDTLRRERSALPKIDIAAFVLNVFIANPAI
jgi:hypothetical protein